MHARFSSSPRARNAGLREQRARSVWATSAGYPSSSPARRRWISASTNGSCRVTFRSRASSTAASTQRSRGPDRATSGWTSNCCGPSHCSPSRPLARSDETVPARKLHVLVDADLTSWQAWNDFATEFAEASGARLVHIDDGGIAGAAFHDRALSINAPVLKSPKRYFDRLPAGLRTRPVVDPCPLWCWSLVTRANDERDSIAALREHAGNVIQPAAPRTPPPGPVWLPAADPHRAQLSP